jgi:hypothetical protein
MHAKNTADRGGAAHIEYMGGELDLFLALVTRASLTH